ncbi:D-isomer specific 2-hydroxyacid dehydrogenase [Aspergillus varians]
MADSSNTTNHHVVAIEAVHCPIPKFDLPRPYTIDTYKDTPQSEIARRIKDATIVLTTTTHLSAEVLSPQVSPKLQLVVIMASGKDCVDKVACKARGITICNCPGTNVDSVSEHVIGSYFATRRRFVKLHNATTTIPADLTKDNHWKTNRSSHPLLHMSDGKPPLLCHQETLGIIGYGALGKRIATLARALGMKVILSDHKTATTPREGRVSFETFLRESTVLVLCLPRTPDTINTISTAEFNKMSPQAVLINVARGGIVDEQALFDAVKSGRISGAAVDVFATEPAGRGSSPLLSPEVAALGLNLTVTPHLAWYAEMTLQNLQASVKDTVEKWCNGVICNEVL